MAEQMVTVLDRENTILNRFIAQMRDVTVQGDSMRFRRNLERAGEIMAYEISKTLEDQPRSVETPLGEAEIMMPDEEIVVATILRAGLPFHQGFLNYFDNAQNAFVSAYRKYKRGQPHVTPRAHGIGPVPGRVKAKKHLSANNCKIWCGSLDAEMTVKSYIVPGMGDAGDLAYGEKL